MALDIDAKLKGKLTCAIKNDTVNLKIFNRALESLKIGALMGFFYPKQKTYELKICENFILPLK